MLGTLPSVLRRARSNQAVKLKYSLFCPRVRESAPISQTQKLALKTSYECCSDDKKPLAELVKVGTFEDVRDGV
jgi:hypothetical protein